MPGDVSTSDAPRRSSRFCRRVSCGDIPAFDLVPSGADWGNTVPMVSDCVHHHCFVFRSAWCEVKNRHQMNLQTPGLDFRAASAPLRGGCWMHRYSDGVHAGQCQSCSQLKVHNFWRQRHWETLVEVRRGLGWGKECSLRFPSQGTSRELRLATLSSVVRTTTPC